MTEFDGKIIGRSDNGYRPNVGGNRYRDTFTDRIRAANAPDLCSGHKFCRLKEMAVEAQDGFGGKFDGSDPRRKWCNSCRRNLP